MEESSCTTFDAARDITIVFGSVMCCHPFCCSLTLINDLFPPGVGSLRENRRAHDSLIVWCRPSRRNLGNTSAVARGKFRTSRSDGSSQRHLDQAIVRRVYRGQSSKKTKNSDLANQALTRVFHMFEDMPGEAPHSNAANDISALLSMYVNDELERAFTLPVVSVAFRWAREMPGAAVTFCRYQMDKAGSRAQMRAEVRSYDVTCSHQLVEHRFHVPCSRANRLHLLGDRGRGRSTGERSRCSPTSSKEGSPNDSITRRSASCKHDGKMISSEFRTFNEWTS